MLVRSVFEHGQGVGLDVSEARFILAFWQGEVTGDKIIDDE